MMNNEYQLIQYCISENDSDNDSDEKRLLNNMKAIFTINDNSSTIIHHIIQAEISIALMIPLLRLFIAPKVCSSLISRDTIRNYHQYLIISLIIFFFIAYYNINTSPDKLLIEIIAFSYIIIHFCLYLFESRNSKRSKGLL